MPDEYDAPCDPALAGDVPGWEPPPVEEVARLLGNYEVLGLIGRSEMGAVYQARQTALDRLVAIKLVPPEISADEDFADRFRKEARVMSRLNHPNIVAGYDFGTTSAGHLFIVMDYVQGPTLHDIIHRPTEAVAGITDPGYVLAPDQALSIVEQVCVALGYAHARGIVHRRLQPGKVMIDTEGQVKVSDFGLSPPSTGADPGATAVDRPGYRAPEQVHGEGVDRRTDVYRLGVMLYEMLCREVPAEVFEAPSARIGCDTRIDAIVLQAIQQAPERRFQSTQEMQSAVAAARVPVPMPLPHLAATPVPSTPEKTKLPLYAMLTVVAALAWAYVHFAKPPGKGGLADPTSSSPTSSGASAARSSGSDATAGEGDARTGETTTNGADATSESAIADTHGDAIATPDGKETPATGKAPQSPKSTTSAQPRSGVEKWLADLDGPRQEAFQKQVAEPFTAGIEELQTRYLASLDAGLAQATTSGVLDQTAIWQTERELFEKAQTVWPDDDGTPPAIHLLRAAYRRRLAQLKGERARRAKTLHASYDAILRKNLIFLTQRDRIDDALLLKKKREEIARTWLETPLVGRVPDSEGWVDLFIALTPVLVEKTGHGWRMLDGELHSPDAKHATLPLPGRFADSSYQVRVKLRQLTATDVFHIVLPVGNRTTGFELDGFQGRYTGLFDVDGKFGRDLPGVVEGKQVKDSEPHILELAVHFEGAHATITSTLDTQPLYNWTGPVAALGHWSGWATTPPGSLALGTVAGDWVVSEIKVKRLEK